MSLKKRSLKIGIALEFENADLRRYLAPKLRVSGLVSEDRNDAAAHRIDQTPDRPEKLNKKPYPPEIRWMASTRSPSRSGIRS